MRLEGTVGEAGKVARMADSEFAVVLLRGGAEQAIQLAQKIVANLFEPVEQRGDGYPKRLSDLGAEREVGANS